MRSAAALALFFALTPLSPAKAQSPALWSVSDADTTIYLLGSVHASDDGPTWLNLDIAAAYQASSEIVLETVIADPAAAAATAVKLGTATRSLRSTLTRPEAATFEAALVKEGVNASALDPYKPWYANMLMSILALTGTSLDRNMSVEAVLQDGAARDGKRLIGLETLEEQFAAFDSIPVAAQVRQLGATVTDPARLRRTTETTVRCWRTGDVECVRAAIDREYDGLPEVRDALLVRRNARWASWIADRMKRPGAVLLAVGVDHFVGAGSLLEQLTSGGLAVKRIGRE